MKIRTEINEVDMGKKIEKISDEAEFFGKMNKIDKHLARLIKKK